MGGIILDSWFLQYFQQVSLELDELGGLEISLLCQESFPSWAPTFQMEADVEGELSQLLRGEFIRRGDSVHAVDCFCNHGLLTGDEKRSFPFLVLSL